MRLFIIDSNVPQFHGVDTNTANEGNVVLNHLNFEGGEILSDSIKSNILVEVFGDDEDLIIEL